MHEKPFELIEKRLRELAGRDGRYRYAGFFSEQELALFESLRRREGWDASSFGGYPDAERRMVRFGSEEALGYEEPWPIACVLVTPAAGRFSEQLEHRHVIGALMSLGIGRHVLGDLKFRDNRCYVFCRQEMAQTLCGLISVAHTPVRVTVLEEDAELPRTEYVRERVNVASLRIDTLAAHLCNLSRTRITEAIAAQQVLLAGEICLDPSRCVKEGDTFSVRGYGKWRLIGVSGVSKKGRLYAEADRFR